MKGKEFLDNMAYVDADLIEESSQSGKITGKSGRGWKAWMAAAACLVLLLGVGLGVMGMNAQVAYAVSIDVNPSILLELNRNKQVVKAEAVNPDAQEIFGDMDLKGAELNVAVNAIIGSMVRRGYVSPTENSILISIEGREGVQELEAELVRQVEQSVESSGFGASVLSQQVDTPADELKSMAVEYGITEGKAELIRKVLRLAGNHTFGELATLKINDLNLLLESYSLDIPTLNHTGTTGSGSYITSQEALKAALTHAGLTEAAYVDEVELDCENGKMVYEVEFMGADNTHYDYLIDAKDGAVLWNRSRAVGGTTQAPVGDMISEERAREIALNHAGVAEQDASYLRTELEMDDKPHYDVSFETTACEYEYEVCAYTGTILDVDVDARHDAPRQTQPAASGITREYAKEIALNHAGVNAGDIRDYECEYEDDDGKPHYEISFEAGTWEYEYKICAQTGNVLHVEKEPRD